MAELARPIGEFRTNVPAAWGVGISGSHHFAAFQPLGLRADFSFLNYGLEEKTVPLSSTVNRVMVDMRTMNNIALVSGGPELMVGAGGIFPYVYGFVGYSYFFTESSANDGDDGYQIANTTNFSDGGLATGWGGGLKIPMRARTVGAAISLDARMTRAGVRTYLKPGDVQDQPDGSLQFTPRTTTADFWQYRLGVSFYRRRR